MILFAILSVERMEGYEGDFTDYVQKHRIIGILKAYGL